MAKTWDISHVELTPVVISDKEFEQVLDEWAEMIYCYLYQLCETQTLVSETSNANVVLGRTGTYG